jgi:hypothetical protein
VANGIFRCAAIADMMLSAKNDPFNMKSRWAPVCWSMVRSPRATTIPLTRNERYASTTSGVSGSDPRERNHATETRTSLPSGRSWSTYRSQSLTVVRPATRLRAILTVISTSMTSRSARLSNPAAAIAPDAYSRQE